jgi:hypothetical protein
VCVTADISQRESRRDRHDITSFELSYTHGDRSKGDTRALSVFSFLRITHDSLGFAFTFLIPFAARLYGENENSRAELLLLLCVFVLFPFFHFFSFFLF